MAERKECPQCGVIGDVEDLFGYRFARLNPPVAQSWCKDCRRNGAAEKRAEKAKTKPAKVARPKVVPIKAKKAPVKIPTDRDQLTKLYRKHFPNDKGNGSKVWSRPVMFMKSKLAKKLK